MILPFQTPLPEELSLTIFPCSFSLCPFSFPSSSLIIFFSFSHLFPVYYYHRYHFPLSSPPPRLHSPTPSLARSLVPQFSLFPTSTSTSPLLSRFLPTPPFFLLVLILALLPSPSFLLPHIPHSFPTSPLSLTSHPSSCSLAPQFSLHLHPSLPFLLPVLIPLLLYPSLLFPSFHPSPLFSLTPSSFDLSSSVPSPSP